MALISLSTVDQDTFLSDLLHKRSLFSQKTEVETMANSETPG